MGALLRNYAAGQSISFNARNTAGTFIAVTIPNTVPLNLQQLAFATAYFSATDTQSLQDAFNSITSGIQQQSIETVTNVVGDPNLGGYLVFSDVLGEYMQFQPGSMTLQFPGFVGSPGTAAPVTGTAIDLTTGDRAIYEPILDSQLSYGGSTPPNVTDLIDASNTASNPNWPHSVRYFADVNRNWIGNYDAAPLAIGAAAMVEIFPMTGSVLIPTGGGSTKLIYIPFHVVTALQSGTFTEIVTPPVGTAGAQVATSRTLAAGDQLVRWHITNWFNNAISTMTAARVFQGRPGGFAPNAPCGHHVPRRRAHL